MTTDDVRKVTSGMWLNDKVNENLTGYMHAQQLTVGNINLQVINFFLQPLSQEERDSQEGRRLLSGYTIYLKYCFTLQNI